MDLCLGLGRGRKPVNTLILMLTSSSLIRLGRTQKYAFEIRNGQRFCIAYDPRTRLWAGTPRIMPVKFALSLLLRHFIASSQIWHEVHYPSTIFFGSCSVFGLSHEVQFFNSLLFQRPLRKKKLDRAWGQTEIFRWVNRHAGDEGPRSLLPSHVDDLAQWF
jgi:hypothetical protein